MQQILEVEMTAVLAAEPQNAPMPVWDIAPAISRINRGGAAVSDCSMQVLKDGPLRVKGKFDLRDANGRPIPVKDGPCMLCRCGESKTKPFCDGSHIRVGFKD